MVRAANTRNVNRPQNHSEDDITGQLENVALTPREKRPETVAVSPREKRLLIHSNRALPEFPAGRKAAKVNAPPPSGLGAQFRQLANAEPRQNLRRQLTPRNITAVSPRIPAASVPSDTKNQQPSAESKVAVNENRNRENENLNGGNDSETRLNLPEDLDGVEKSSSGSKSSCDNIPAAGHGVDPKFMTRQTFRSRISDDPSVLAEQLKAMGQVCTPLCSPRRLDRRRQKRAQKRIQPQLQDQARPSISVLHPPCVISGAVYSVLAEQYRQRYRKNLRELYNQQLEKEVNIEQFRRETRNSSRSRKNCRAGRHSKKMGLGVTGKFSNSSHEDEDDDVAGLDNNSSVSSVVM